jgi:hypothetical protein
VLIERGRCLEVDAPGYPGTAGLTHDHSATARQGLAGIARQHAERQSPRRWPAVDRDWLGIPRLVWFVVAIFVALYVRFVIGAAVFGSR